MGRLSTEKDEANARVSTEDGVLPTLPSPLVGVLFVAVQQLLLLRRRFPFFLPSGLLCSDVRHTVRELTCTVSNTSQPSRHTVAQSKSLRGDRGTLPFGDTRPAFLLRADERALGALTWCSSLGLCSPGTPGFGSGSSSLSSSFSRSLREAATLRSWVELSLAGIRQKVSYRSTTGEITASEARLASLDILLLYCSLSKHDPLLGMIQRLVHVTCSS